MLPMAHESLGPPRRLFLPDLGESHLRLLQRAVECSMDADVEQWLHDMRDGNLMLWEWPQGLLGLRDTGEKLFVEFLVGRGFDLRKMVAWAKATWPGPITLFTRSPAHVRLFRRAGFEPVATFMRL